MWIEGGCADPIDHYLAGSMEFVEETIAGGTFLRDSEWARAGREQGAVAPTPIASACVDSRPVS